MSFYMQFCLIRLTPWYVSGNFQFDLYVFLGHASHNRFEYIKWESAVSRASCLKHFLRLCVHSLYIHLNTTYNKI